MSTSIPGGVGTNTSTAKGPSTTHLLNSSLESLKSLNNNAPSLASSIEFSQMPATSSSPNLQTLSAMQGSQQKNHGNFLAQLETMMGAVKKEASALEGMKQKLKDMDELKRSFLELKHKYKQVEKENDDLQLKLKDSDQQCKDIRVDFQRLNDFFNTEKNKQVELQQANTRLEQQVASITMEKDFFWKESQSIPELKKAAKAHKAKLAQALADFEQERAALAGQLDRAARELQAAEKDKAELGAALWSSAEEGRALRRDLELRAAADAQAQQRSEAAAMAATRLGDQYQMTVEDLRVTNARRTESSGRLQAQARQTQAELQALRAALRNKEDECTVLSSNYKRREDSHQSQALAYNANLAALQETVKELGGKHQDLLQDRTALKQKLAETSSELDRAKEALDQLQGKLAAAQTAMATREVELSHDVKAALNHRDEADFKLQSLTAQFEALQEQAKVEQSKLWEDVRRLKESESQLLEEADKLSQELHEKTLLLHAAENEKNGREASMRGELSGATQVSNALKAELERRLEDLVQVRRERDSLLEEKEKLGQSAAELADKLTKNEALFRKTIDADRQKVKAEMQSRNSRIKSLEAEKQELLRETAELMKQLSENQAEIANTRQEAKEAAERATAQSELASALQASQSEVLAQLKAVERANVEQKEAANRQQSQLQEDAARMDALLKESKKSSSTQLLELSAQLKSMYEELEETKREKLLQMETVRKLQGEAERMRADQQAASKLSDDSQHQLMGDINALRRELQDHRSKMKVVLESKTKQEMELINVRTELTKAEYEVSRQLDTTKQLEGSVRTYVDKLAAAERAASDAVEANAKLKAKLHEQSDLLERKSADMELLHRDMEQVERDGLMEVRRLRVQLNSAEQEVNELRQTVPLIQRELTEAKANVSKMQSSSSSSVSNLLQELKNAEDALSRERRRAQSVADEQHSRLVELQLTLEKTKEGYEETLSRSRTEKSERDLKLMHCEAELDRLRSAVASRDARIDELEQQHQMDRLRSLELKDRIDTDERALQELRTQVDIEQGQRKRLEGKLRSLSALTADNDGKEASSGMLLTSRSGFGDSRVDRLVLQGGTSGRERLRQQVPAQDKETEREWSDAPDYDTVISSYSNHSSSGAATALANRSSSTLNQYGMHSAATRQNSMSEAIKSPVMSPLKLTSNSRSAHLQQSQGQYYASEAPRSPTPSPRRKSGQGGSTTGAQSPVVDRVSAALAARATAESSRNALKQAQQARLQHSSSAFAPDRDRTSLHRPALDASSPTVSDKNESLSSAIEDTIQRTQRVLNRRLQQPIAPKPVSEERPSFTEERVSDSSGGRRGSVGTPTSGRGGGIRLNEVLQQASQLYPADDAEDPQRLEGDDDMDELFNSIDTPQVVPASPPLNKGDLCNGELNIKRSKATKKKNPKHPSSAGKRKNADNSNVAISGTAGASNNGLANSTESFQLPSIRKQSSTTRS